MRTDLSAGQRGEKQTEHHSKPAAVASLPSRPSDSLTQTTLPWQASGRVAATPLAPPAYCLRNRSNLNWTYCAGSMNSVAVALHWSMVSSGGNPRDFGSLGPALAVLSRLRKLELFTHATWKDLLNGWRRPAQQHDVTELMSFVMDPDSRHAVGPSVYITLYKARGPRFPHPTMPRLCLGHILFTTTTNLPLLEILVRTTSCDTTRMLCSTSAPVEMVGEIVSRASRVAAGDCRALRHFGTLSGRHCYRQPLSLPA